MACDWLPTGKLLGALPVSKSECPVEKVSGVQNVYLVFTDAAVNWVDWFKFE